MTLLFPSKWVSSPMNGQEVASAIVHFLTHRDDVDGSHFALDVTRFDGSDPQRLWVRPAHDRGVHLLVTGQELVRCEIQGGELIDVLLPKPHDRELAPALIVRATDR